MFDRDIYLESALFYRFMTIIVVKLVSDNSVVKV